mgnify:CR=1 FL=1
MDRFVRSRLLTGLVYALLGLAVLYMLQLLRPMIAGAYAFLRAVLAPFLIALIISYVLNPVVNLLHARKVPRTAAVLLIYAVFFTALTVILVNLIPMLMKQLRELNEHLPGLTYRAQNLMEDMRDSGWMPRSVREGFNEAFRRLEEQIARTVGGVLESVDETVNVLFVAFIVPFLVFYMLKDFQLLERTALKVVPEKHRRHTVKMLVDIDAALGSYIRGQLLVCLCVGVLAYLGYLLIGMPYALLLAGLVAVFNVIPYLGPFFGAAPAIVAASTVSLKMMLLVAAVNLAVQILEGNVISPQVVGRSLHMHPLLIIFVLLVGGELAGIAGLILAVPAYAALKVVAQHLWIYYRSRRDAAGGEAEGDSA